ncbi:hypothetical protein [Pseudazoarcus pumilus]|uniref:Uncharacterized protein n=1 Tax=Pseudazoarcus pumilus TaxID=2067960 RepID=A0A2I6S9S9_9RHOO|nr:hypothetical protein [Pseudazoarcus pumilus]AUN96004.1 hypothetical protein C0099_14285 [Pseudazoarcus pumilus]
MDSTTVYVKTALGHEEVATRGRHVPARVRAMLIIIDGRRSVGELLANHPAPDEARDHLQTLVDGGFIAPADAVAADSTPAAGMTGEDFAETRRAVAAALVDFLGPDADTFTPRIEHAASRDELTAECETLFRMLEQTVGRARAERFRDTVMSRLG